jgi:hypothetical protein
MTRTLLALILALAWAPRVAAHQLDEYLQAARLALAKNRVGIELDLSPGVSIAPQIFAIVDSDGDGRAAPQEIERYARRVIEDLSLRVDGRSCPVTLTRAEASSWSEIQEGTGRFRVEALAEMPVLKKGRHHIEFENLHQSANAVYLVNPLKPQEDDIVIRGQRRDVLQRSIDLDVEVRSAVEPVTWLSLACAGLIALVVAGARRSTHLVENPHNRDAAERSHQHGICSTSWNTRTPAVTPASASSSSGVRTTCTWCRSSKTSTRSS